jgi:hypothetical protein
MIDSPFLIAMLTGFLYAWVACTLLRLVFDCKALKRKQETLDASIKDLSKSVLHGKLEHKRLSIRLNHLELVLKNTKETETKMTIPHTIEKELTKHIKACTYGEWINKQSIETLHDLKNCPHTLISAVANAFSSTTHIDEIMAACKEIHCRIREEIKGRPTYTETITWHPITSKKPVGFVLVSHIDGINCHAAQWNPIEHFWASIADIHIPLNVPFTHYAELPSGPSYLKHKEESCH